jgi:homospermidine synthase
VGRKGPTAVVEHGANPGLISHFTKQGLIDIANTMIGERKAKGRKAEALEGFIAAGQASTTSPWSSASRSSTAASATRRSPTSRSRSTSSSTPGASRASARRARRRPSSAGATHEKTLPAHAYRQKTGPKNQICIARMGINTWVRSWVPNYTIHGMVVRHGEAFTISDKLTVWEGKRAVYRPTVHYAYCPCDEAVVSLNELRGRNYGLQPKLRIMNDEITKGADILGALIMGHPTSPGGWAPT